jgi:endo-1,4-beta-xylanase
LAALVCRFGAVGFAAEAPANFVVNPGFESGVTPWTPRGSESLLISTQAQTGAGAVWVTNRSADWQGPAQSLFGRLRPGASYVCSAWVRAETVTSQPLRLTFEQRDSVGTRYFTVASATVTNNAWTFLTGAFSLSVMGAVEEITLYVEGPAAGVDLRVDNVAVVPLSGLRLASGSRAVLFGGISESQVNTDWPFGRVAGTDYQIAGTENALKFASLHPASNTYSFSGADAILDHATAHGQLSRGHTLLWHNSVPGWVANSTSVWTTAQFQTVAYQHIDTVVARYRNRLFCWDVVNEAFNSDGTMRGTVWYNAPGIGYAGQGTKYIEEVFKRARAADPDCELIYNDFSTETVNSKSTAIYTMAQDFVARGVPLDGIGFQFHLSSTPNLASMRSNLQRFQDLGLNLHITEMDVSVAIDTNGVATTNALAAQGDTYFNVIGTALAFPRMTVIQTWGFSDRYSWIPAFKNYTNGAALPLDEDFNRKPAWWALRNVLANQAETLAIVASSSGDSSVPSTNTSFSAGAARLFQANAAGDFITLAALVPYSGQYNVRLGVRKNTSSGILQFAATPSPGGVFANVGATQDTYASSTSYAELNLGSFTFAGAGTNLFRLTVAGKNGSSTDYDLALDYLRLTPTGADGNQPPALTSIADQSVNVGAGVGPLGFAVSDRETVESALTITAASSNPALIPTGNIGITGGGSERLLVATPVANQTGVATITINLTDAAGAAANASFVIRVTQAPTIGGVTDQTVEEDTATTALPFTVGDDSVPPELLVVTATSSNTNLVPIANIVIGLITNQWISADIGAVAAAGSTTLGDTITMTASGADIYGTADEGRFVWQPMSGDGEMVARVTSLQPVSVWSKAGVMMRASTNTGSVNCYMHLSASNGVEFTRRLTNGAATVSTIIGGIQAPSWVRLVKTGSNFAGFYATNSAGAPGPWIQVGSTAAISAMATDLLRGLAGTSHSDGALCASSYDHVTANVNRTVTITPSPNQTGSTTIQLIVTDGVLTATNSFTLTVNPVDDPPGISSISRLPDGNMTITASAEAGTPYRLWATTNLMLSPISDTWELITNGVVVESPFALVDLGATNQPRRFYRFSTP